MQVIGLLQLTELLELLQAVLAMLQMPAQVQMLPLLAHTASLQPAHILAANHPGQSWVPAGGQADPLQPPWPNPCDAQHQGHLGGRAARPVL